MLITLRSSASKSLQVKKTHHAAAVFACGCARCTVPSSASRNLRGVRCYAQMLRKSVDIHAAVNLNDRTTDDDSPAFVLIIVVGTPLVDVSAAAVFLGLARGQSAIAPPCFLPATPSRRTAVTVTVAITAVLVSVATLPAIIVVVDAPVGVRVPLSFVLSVIRHES